jgi:hypothetical protein
MPDDNSSLFPAASSLGPLGSVAQPGGLTLNPFDRDVLIRTLYGEGADQPVSGQEGIVQTMLNRVAQGGLGAARGPAGVAKFPGQYSTWNPIGRGGNMIGRNLQVGSPDYNAMGDVVDRVYAGIVPDITGGSQNYYVPTQVSPSWAGPLAAQQNLQIGMHRFVGAGPTRITPAAVAGSLYDEGVGTT